MRLGLSWFSWDVHNRAGNYTEIAIASAISETPDCGSAATLGLGLNTDQGPSTTDALHTAFRLVRIDVDRVVQIVYRT